MAVQSIDAVSSSARLKPFHWSAKEHSHGPLADAIRHFLHSPRSVTVRELCLIRRYCVQWIESPLWDSNPHGSGEILAKLRSEAPHLFTPQALAQWISEANVSGLDPL